MPVWYSMYSSRRFNSSQRDANGFSSHDATGKASGWMHISICLSTYLLRKGKRITAIKAETSQVKDALALKT